MGAGRKALFPFPSLNSYSYLIPILSNILIPIIAGIPWHRWNPLIPVPMHITISTVVLKCCKGRQAKSMGVPNFRTLVAQKPLDRF